MPAPVAYAVDANVILRLVLGDHPELSAKAQAIFAAAEAGTVALECDPVNLAEVVWVLSSHYEVPCRDIADALLPLAKMEGLRVPEKDRYLRALELYGEGSLRFGDACTCATAQAAGQGRLLSFDRALSHVPGVERTERVAVG